MTSVTIAWMSVALGVAAALYASVGHGGASGYLAVMALAGVAPTVMRPVALLLNVLAAGIALLRFHRRQGVACRLLAPFAVASVPLAFVGGWLHVPGHLHKQLVGAVLVLSALRLGATARASEQTSPHRGPPLAVSLGCGAALGLLSGVTGVGGGIFLSPLLLLAGWADARTVAGVSAAFILLNSIAGLAGFVAGHAHLPAVAIPWMAAVAVGAWLGAGVGSRRLDGAGLRRALAVVLLVAGAKMVAGV